MFCKIDLIPNGELPSSEEIQDLLWKFLISLERNGQILKDHTLVEGKYYSLYVTLPKEDSFDETYDNAYVKQYREKLSALFNIELTPLGKNLASQRYCHCKSRTAIEMQTYYQDVDSIFTCCDCGRPIALYELPLPDGQNDFYFFQDWQENYSATDTIWMNSLCDEFSLEQLISCDSSLNQQGIELAEKLTEKLGYPVYYHLFGDCMGDCLNEDDFTIMDGKKIRVCPECKKAMKPLGVAGEYEIAICEACKLSADVR